MSNMHHDQLKVLVVEDNQLNAKFAEAVLKKLKCKIDFATNGKKGVEMFLQNEYDLILMDIQMPLMNGLEATKEIRKIENQISIEKPVIIIAVTAFALEHDRKNCIETGMDDYITKPYKPDDMIHTIRKYFPEDKA